MLRVKKYYKFSSWGVKIDFWAIVIIFLVYAFLYSLLSVVRHDHFQSQGIDFSIYDQVLWLNSHFYRPFSTITNLLDFADRFRPIMIPLSMIYWFTQNERALLIFQSVIMTATVFPIWLLARKLLPKALAIVIAFLYLNYVGVQSIIVSDFHEMSLLPFFMAFLFYFLEKEKWRSFFITLIICLSVREHVGFLLATMGIYIYLAKKRMKFALATILISILWSVIVIKVIMPFFGRTNYYELSTHTTLSGAIFNYIIHPNLAVENYFVPIVKTQTLFWSFSSFAFVPLLYLPLLPMITFQFASRFLDPLHPIRWTLYYQYSAELAVLLSVSTIYSLKNILDKLKGYKYTLQMLIIILILSQIITNIILASPLKNLLKKQFYLKEPWMYDTNKIISLVPSNSSVAAQNNLLPHLSHRKNVYILPNTEEAEYIVVDLHPGQNNWNFYSGNLASATLQFKQLILSKNYTIVGSSENAYLIKRSL